jgi:hypothetical protein
MNILVLSRIVPGQRKTMDDHLNSFRRYVDGVTFFYCDFFLRLPLFLKWIKWDGIILHYTLLSERWDPQLWQHHLEKMAKIGSLKGFKVAIPQDEYSRIPELQTLLKRAGVHTVFTCLSPVDYDKIYPFDKTGIHYRISTCPGFVDEATFATIRSIKPPSRDVDIGYRARSLPFWLGRHGQIKKEVADRTLEAKNSHNLKLDISTDPKDVFYGDDWIQFLLRCRCVLGCLGGASLYDSDGSIRPRVESFTERHPDATFDEVEQNCFPNQDYSLSLFALSPRHFECAMTKTCQILVEGDYQGIFIPGRHFIELKKDYSNLDDVFAKAADAEYCQKIGETAYQDIALSDKYTYRAFANQVIDHIRQHTDRPRNNRLLISMVQRLLMWHNRNPALRFFFFRAWRKFQTKCKAALH